MVYDRNRKINKEIKSNKSQSGTLSSQLCRATLNMLLWLHLQQILAGFYICFKDDCLVYCGFGIVVHLCLTPFIFFKIKDKRRAQSEISKVCVCGHSIRLLGAAEEVVGIRFAEGSQ